MNYSSVFQKVITFFVVLLLVATSALTTNAQERQHTIQNGETLSSIAKKHKTTVAELLKLNPDAAKGIRAGAILVLPGGAEVARQKPEAKVTSMVKPGEMHEVMPGESLYKIAKKYHVAVKDLETWNQITNSDLKSGTRIRIAAPEGQEKQTTPIPTKPAPKPVATDPTIGTQAHVVAKGETLSSIAKTYQTTVANLKKLNGLNTAKLNLGQTIQVPGKVEVATPNPKPVQSVIEKIKPVLETAKPMAEKPAEVEAPKPTITPAQPEKEFPAREEVKMTSGIREINNALGYTRVVETGFAEAIEGEGNSKKHLCLHKSAPVGSILQVKNEMNGQTVFVKVIGKLPDTGTNEKLIIRISRQAYDRLLAVGKRFPVEVSYPQAEQ